MPIETSTSAAYLYSIGGIGIVGTLFGMPLDALILGGLSGAVVRGLHPAASRQAGFFSILLSMLLAGAVSPVLAEWLVQRGALDPQRAAELLKPLLPVVLGGGWPWLLPLVREHILGRLKKEDKA
ncbi:Uncharacterised protein [Kingella potus]|uniref:Uncharacterized protein n=2 Tax=Kingella potus TaxID=265175 RepID=A0A377QYN8_9NEIS|nr:hypothetical protein [Kingella potus]UOP02034.1 hypothetical protein LVJ84_14375 [Kingella potus]STQ99860.1 Uncharacterised protein [Kingella potus]STR02405.1 Uncharacterised protein [Kingella potus]